WAQAFSPQGVLDDGAAVSGSPNHAEMGFEVLRQLQGAPKFEEVCKTLSEEISTWQQNPQFATKLLDKLGTAPVAPDTVDLVLRCVRRAHALNIWQVNAATNAHVRRGRWQRALALAASLSDWSLEPDVVTASSCVRGCMESSHWLLSLAHLKHMKRMQAGISRYTKALLVPLKSTSNWRASLFHFANLADVRVEADLVSRGQVLGACKGRWPAAVQISSRVQVKQNIFLDALGGQWQLLLSVLWMRLADEVSFNTAIHAVPRWNLAWSLFSELGARSLEPDVVSFGSLAGSGSGWERSLEPVLRSRRAARLWNAWLGTAQNRWQEACQGLGAFVKDSLRADVITYTSCMKAAEVCSVWRSGV
ncbi:unnamed protein product, partial [Effrenium voratum]